MVVPPPVYDLQSLVSDQSTTQTLRNAVEEHNAGALVFSSLAWRDCIVLASVSTGLFTSLKVWLERLSTDVSCGVSPCPIPCDSAGRHHQCADGSTALIEGAVANTRRQSKASSSSTRNWYLGGPVPPSFVYLNVPIFPQGVPDTADDLLEGCLCRDSCTNESGRDPAGACPCVQLNMAAQSGAAPLFECHAACSCKPGCNLRATQAENGQDGGEEGARPPAPWTRLRYMGRKGWGAYATQDIPAGKFVAEYTGEVLPVDEARKRVPAYDRDGSNYLLTTQEFFQGGKQVWQTIVDATNSGNVSRFFNHSCEPTLSVFVIRRGSLLPHLVFFTKDRLPAGRELTYDYGAAGSAGGDRTSRRDINDRGVTHEGHEPVRKVQRRTRVMMGDAEAATAGKSSRRIMDDCSPHAGMTLTDDCNDDDRHCGRVRDGSGIGAQPSPTKHTALLQLCLCGSRRCRGYLPYNRAIL